MAIARLPIPGLIKVISKCIKECGSESKASGVCVVQDVISTKISDHAPQRPRQDWQDSSVAGVCWWHTHVGLSSCWVANCYRPGLETIVGSNGVDQPAPRLMSAV